MSSISFTPVVYEHAAAFLGLSPGKVSRDPELMARAHAEAYLTYGHQPITVGIDVYTIEAEAYGAKVLDPGGKEVPVIGTPCVESAGDILALGRWDPASGSRFGLAFEAAGMLRSRFPGADIRIPASGPFSIASSLLGLENLLCECLVDPDSVGRALEFLAAGQIEVLRQAAARGFPVVMFESAATPPLLSPELFHVLELPALRMIAEAAGSIIVDGESVPRRPSFVLGGDTEPILESMLSLDPGFLICPAETDQTAFMNRMATRPDVGVRMNMEVSRLMASDEEEARAEVSRVARLACSDSRTSGRRACIGTGVLPVDADPARILRLGTFVLEHFSR